MAAGIPSTNQIVPFAQEALQTKSKQGYYGTLPAEFFKQYSASTSLTNSTTETNVLSGTNFRGSVQIPAGALAWANLYDPTNSVGATAGPGAKMIVRVVGTLTNTATPTLRLRLGLTNGAGTTTYVADTTALTTATITGTSRFVAEFEVQVVTYSATGSVLGGGFYEYHPTTITVNKFYAPQLTSSSFDTTGAYTVGLFATWGTANASNTLIVQDASIVMLS